MSTAFAHVAYIEKENISNLNFPEAEVLQSVEGIKKRSDKITQAIGAGNVAQFKVMIFFEDDQEIREVETTIWNRDNSGVYLKNSIVIPIHRIHKIKFNQSDYYYFSLFRSFRLPSLSALKNSAQAKGLKIESGGA